MFGQSTWTKSDGINFGSFVSYFTPANSSLSAQVVISDDLVDSQKGKVYFVDPGSTSGAVTANISLIGPANGARLNTFALSLNDTVLVGAPYAQGGKGEVFAVKLDQISSDYDLAGCSGPICYKMRGYDVYNGLGYCIKSFENYVAIAAPGTDDIFVFDASSGIDVFNVNITDVKANPNLYPNIAYINYKFHNIVSDTAGLGWSMYFFRDTSNNLILTLGAPDYPNYTRKGGLFAVNLDTADWDNPIALEAPEFLGENANDQFGTCVSGWEKNSKHYLAVGAPEYWDASVKTGVVYLLPNFNATYVNGTIGAERNPASWSGNNKIVGVESGGDFGGEIIQVTNTFDRNETALAIAAPKSNDGGNVYVVQNPALTTVANLQTYAQPDGIYFVANSTASSLGETIVGNNGTLYLADHAADLVQVEARKPIWWQNVPIAFDVDENVATGLPQVNITVPDLLASVSATITPESGTINGKAVEIFNGNETEINTLLAGSVYTPATDSYTDTKFTIEVGYNGYNSSVTIPVVLMPTMQAPNVSGIPGSGGFVWEEGESQDTSFFAFVVNAHQLQIEVDGSDLPLGLSAQVNGDNITLSGDPQQLGNFTFSFNATDLTIFAFNASLALLSSAVQLAIVAKQSSSSSIGDDDGLWALFKSLLIPGGGGLLGTVLTITGQLLSVATIILAIIKIMQRAKHYRKKVVTGRKLEARKGLMSNLEGIVKIPENSLNRFSAAMQEEAEKHSAKINLIDHKDTVSYLAWLLKKAGIDVDVIFSGNGDQETQQLLATKAYGFLRKYHEKNWYLPPALPLMHVQANTRKFKATELYDIAPKAIKHVLSCAEVKELITSEQVLQIPGARDFIAKITEVAAKQNIEIAESAEKVFMPLIYDLCVYQITLSDLFAMHKDQARFAKIILDCLLSKHSKSTIKKPLFFTETNTLTFEGVLEASDAAAAKVANIPEIRKELGMEVEVEMDLLGMGGDARV